MLHRSTIVFPSLLILLFMVSGCKKVVDNVQENAVLEIITRGQWVVTRFEVGGEEKLPEYAAFTFQFFRNGAVDAIQNGQPNITGTWAPLVQSLSIRSEFSTQGLPLSRFNGTWAINRTTNTTVEASREEAGVLFRLGLRSL